MSHQGFVSSQPADGESQVLMLDGDFDRSKTEPFEHALEDALDAGRPRLVVDLRGVRFLDSTMLRALIRGLGDAVARGGHLALIRPNANIWRVFVLTGLSQTLPAFGRLDEALASFDPRS